MNLGSFDSFCFDMSGEQIVEILRAIGKTPNKKTLKFHLKLNFNNFQERRNEKILG